MESTCSACVHDDHIEWARFWLCAHCSHYGTWGFSSLNPAAIRVRHTKPHPEANSNPAATRRTYLLAIRYSITLPAGWQLQEVSGDWNGTTASPAGEPGTDAFYKSNPGEFVPLEIGFLPVNAGTTVKDWEKAETARPQEWTHPCTTDPNLESATVGGEPALLQRVSCPNHPGVNVYLVHKNQGIYMDYQGNLASIHIFESALQTFTFH